MGEAYRARDPQLGRDVAVKVIQTADTPSPDRLRRFEIEARAVAQLSHPNVLTVFDVGTCDGVLRGGRGGAGVPWAAGGARPRD